MTSPIDTAYVEVKPLTKGFEKDLKNDIDNIFNGVQQSIRKSMSDITADIERGVDDASNAFGRLGRDIDQVNNRAHDSRGIDDFIKDISRSVTNGRSVITGALDGIASAMTNTVGSFGTGTGIMIASIVALLPFILGLAAAVASLSGILLAVPAGLAAIAATALTAVVGFSGFTAALKKSTAAGGAAVDNTHQIAQAERRLADAQRSARSAQENINRARQQARRDLEDLRFSLIRAAQDERGAELSILEAQQRVKEARKSGNRLERQEAQLALERAITARDELLVNNKRLATDAAVTAKKGVEGSDQVTAALESQRQALRAVTEAQYALAQARKPQGGGGGIDTQAAALAALAPAARAVAKEFIALEPAFAAIKQRTQEALFKPLQGILTDFGKNTLPSISDGMEKVAGSLGKFLANIGKKLSTPAAGKFFEKIFDTASKFIDNSGPGLLQFFESVGAAIEKGLPFIDRFGVFLGEAFTKIAEFITGAIADGSFENFFETAVTTFKELGPLLKSIGGFLGVLFSPNMVAIGLMVIETFTAFFDIITGVADFFITDIPRAKGEFTLFLAKLYLDIVKFIEDIPKKVSGFANKFINAGKNLIKGFFDGLKSGGSFIGGFAGRIADAIKGSVNDVIRGLNWGLDVVDAVFPGSIPRISMLAAGGMTTGPTLAGIGEAGREAVIPLDDPRTINALMRAGLGGGGPSVVFGPGAINVSFDGTMPTQQEAFQTGNAVGRGILNVLASRNVRTQVRTV